MEQTTPTPYVSVYAITEPTPDSIYAVVQFGGKHSSANEAEYVVAAINQAAPSVAAAVEEAHRRVWRDIRTLIHQRGVNTFEFSDEAQCALHAEGAVYLTAK